MSRLAPLPQVMVAPNGARRGKADHPAIPITVGEIVETARACFDAGARALHAHVRDHNGAHVLDAGLYRELIDEISWAVPGMPVQITTEAVGRYTPAEQRALVEAVRPEGVSVALREMLPENGAEDAAWFYREAREAGIEVQHILYEPRELHRLLELWSADRVPGQPLQALFVLGRYSETPATPGDLQPWLERLTGAQPDIDWAACAFGPAETDCLAAAVAAGGKARIGFENNLTNRTGDLVPDNASRVAELVQMLGA